MAGEVPLGQRAEVAALTLLAALVIAVYAPALSGSFVFDDFPNIVTNPAIQIERLSPEALLGAAFNDYCPNRPVANLSFALQLRLHGPNPAGFHAFNLLVHLATVLAFYAWMKGTLSLPGVRLYTM